MRPFSIPSILFFAAVFCLITVSFNNSWYHINLNSEYFDGTKNVTEFRELLNYYPTKIQIGKDMTLWFNGTNGNYTFTDHEKVSYNKFYKEAIGLEVLNFKKLIDASFSFAILAWVVSLVMIVISVIDLLGKDIPFKIGKFLGFVVFIFSLLSFLIYIGVPGRLYKDCDETYLDCTRIINEAYFGFHKKFIETYYGEKDQEFKTGSSIGWNCVTISCAVALCGSVYNLFFFSHEKGTLR